MIEKIHNIPRLFYSLPIENGQSITLGDEQSHYLKNVLRRDAGDSVKIFNAAHGEWIGSISTISKKSVTLDIPTDGEPRDSFILFAS
jgi:16S rRNA (uracil1498-N3)-methyltransferase